MVRKMLSLFLAIMMMSVALYSVSAHPGQHGEPGGHLYGTGAWGPVELVGQVFVHDAADDRVADVGALGNYAYLAAYVQPDCAGPEGGGPDGGVYVIDISDPANPVEVGFIPAHQDTYVGEGVQALNISTAEFTFDTLRVNGLAGDDALNASGLAAGVLTLTLDGGDGTDTLTGSPGTDIGLNGEVLINIP